PLRRLGISSRVWVSSPAALPEAVSQGIPEALPSPILRHLSRPRHPALRLAADRSSIVEPDFYRMSVPGVTAHFARMHIRDQHLGSDAAFEALLEQVREEMGHAVAR